MSIKTKVVSAQAGWLLVNLEGGNEVAIPRWKNRSGRVVRLLLFPLTKRKTIDNKRRRQACLS